MAGLGPIPLGNRLWWFIVHKFSYCVLCRQVVLFSEIQNVLKLYGNQILGTLKVSLIDRSIIILCPYLRGSTIGGFTVIVLLWLCTYILSESTEQNIRLQWWLMLVVCIAYKIHQTTVMALIMLVAFIVSEAISLRPHINNSTLSYILIVLLMLLLPNKSTVKYSLASHPHSILQHQSLSVSGCGGRVWRLKTTLREPVQEFSRATPYISFHIKDM